MRGHGGTGSPSSAGVGLIVLAPDGAVAEVNAAAERILGLARVDLLGSDFVARDDIALETPSGRRLSPAERPESVAIAGESASAQTLRLLTPHGLRLVDYGAEPVAGGAVLMMVDITDFDRRLESLEREAAEFRLLAESAAHAVIRWSPVDGLIWTSPSLSSVLGMSPSSNHLGIDDFVGLAAPEHHADLRRFLDSGEPWQLTLRPARGPADGREPGWLEVTAAPVIVADRAEWHIRVRNVTDARRAGLRLAASEARWRAAFDHGPVGLALVADTGVITAANHTLKDLLGHDPHGDSVAEIIHSRDRRAVRRALDGVLEGTEEDTVLRVRLSVPVTETDARDWRWVEWTVARVDPDAAQGLDRLVVTVVDIDERMQAEQTLRFQADHDLLSELPNRRSITRHLKQAIARAERHGYRLAVVFIDLDGFKSANDSLGHAAGDKILTSAADRLRHTLRSGDVVGRFGGDEFVLVAEHVNSESEAKVLAQRVTEALDVKMSVSGRSVQVTASVGVAMSGPGSDANSLLRDADAAMYRAKRRGRARWEFYDERMASFAIDRFALEQDLRNGLRRDQFTIATQGIVDLSNGQRVGREALLRFRHPRRGVVLPGDFLPVAEATALIVPIGERVLRMAVDLLAADPDCGWLSVNISGRQLAEPGLAELVAAILGERGIDPKRLLVEVTETALFDTDDAVAELERIADAGVPLALDDFGTGYSSLTRLRGLPVSVLKLDRSFVSGMRHDDSAAAVIASVVDLGHALGMTVIAEGVETEDQFESLRELGCDGAQGFLFDEPLLLE